MTWSVNAVIPAGGEVDLAELKEQALSQNPECADQFEAARIAVQGIILSGAVGRGKSLHISMSGHSNPDHEPRPGWANDAIVVQVSQI